MFSVRSGRHAANRKRGGEWNKGLFFSEWQSLDSRLKTNRTKEIRGNGYYKHIGAHAANERLCLVWGCVRGEFRAVCLYKVPGDLKGDGTRCGWRKLADVERSYPNGTRIVFSDTEDFMSVGEWGDGVPFGLRVREYSLFDNVFWGTKAGADVTELLAAAKYL